MSHLNLATRGLARRPVPPEPGDARSGPFAPVSTALHHALCSSAPPSQSRRNIEVECRVRSNSVRQIGPCLLKSLLGAWCHIDAAKALNAYCGSSTLPQQADEPPSIRAAQRRQCVGGPRRTRLPRRLRAQPRTGRTAAHPPAVPRPPRPRPRRRRLARVRTQGRRLAAPIPPPKDVSRAAACSGPVRRAASRMRIPTDKRRVWGAACPTQGRPAKWARVDSGSSG